jgi:N-carbamoyl-L-amino-acid hydrolase
MRSGFRPRRSLELLAFTSEEPTRFGIGCLGSRLLSGSLGPEAGETLKDREGNTLNDVRRPLNFAGPLADVRLAQGYYSSFVELHIEQGPILEQKGLDIGVVTAIAAPSSLRIFIEGEGGHAGAVLMPTRHDAFLAGAEIALALEDAALTSGAIDTVATTGVCQVFPGAVNSIPSQVRLEIDVRDIDMARRDAVLQRLRQATETVSAKRGVKVRIEPINADPPATCDPKIVSAVERACQTHGASWQQMISRAYHDSLFMSLVSPVGMIFIPCRNGVSHRPDEYSSPEAIAKGALVLAQAMADLAS